MYLTHAHPDEVKHTLRSALRLWLLISDHCSGRCADPWTSYKLLDITNNLVTCSFGRPPSLLSVAEVRHAITGLLVAGLFSDRRFEALWKQRSKRGSIMLDPDLSRTYNVASN